MTKTIGGVYIFMSILEITFIPFSMFTLVIIRRGSWVKLFNKVERLESQITVRMSKKLRQRQLCWLVFKLAAILSLFFLLNSLKYYSMIRAEIIKAAFVVRTTELITNAYITLLSMMYIVLCNWLRTRYEYIIVILDDTMRRTNMKRYEDIKTVAKLYKIAYKAVEQANNIISSIIFFAICISAIFILYSVSAAIEDTKNNDIRFLRYFSPLSIVVSR